MSKKPCDGCPDADNFVGVNSKVPVFALPQAYFEPTGKNPLAMLGRTLPPHDGIRRQFQRPVFDHDGSFEYPRLAGDVTPPDKVDGYRRDEENAWRFVPIWPECKLRQMGTKIKANGCIEVVARCNNPEVPTFSKVVPCRSCIDCPGRK